MSDLKPITLWSLGPSPNPWKVAIILKELKVPYKFEFLDFVKVKQEPYTSVNPNGRVPAIQDPNTGITLWESGAIIDYLIEKYDKDAALQYTSFPEKHHTRSWSYFQVTGQGPYFGQKWWFSKFHPEQLPSAIERYSNEVRRIIGVIESHLEKQGTDYLVGDRITYADLMFIPYARDLGLTFGSEFDNASWGRYNAWLERMYERPAVAKVLAEYDAIRIKYIPASE